MRWTCRIARRILAPYPRRLRSCGCGASAALWENAVEQVDVGPGDSLSFRRLTRIVQSSRHGDSPTAVVAVNMGEAKHMKQLVHGGATPIVGPPVASLHPILGDSERTAVWKATAPASGAPATSAFR